MKETNFSPVTLRLLRNIALVSAAFAVLLSILLILNWLQVKSADPLNSKALTTLQERLRANPDDEQLRNEIRELDLLARKAFFTNQWQVKTGGLLLLLSVVVIVICLQAIEYVKKKVPPPPGERPDPFWEKMKISRKWIAGTGITIILAALAVAFLSQGDLGHSTEENDLSGMNSSGMKEDAKAAADTSSATIQTADSLKIQDTANLASSVNPNSAKQEHLNYWPCFRGPGGIGISSNKNIPVSWDGKSGKNIRWKTEIPLPGFNSPVILGNKVFLTGASDARKEVYCIDLNSGKFLWTVDVGKVAGSPAQAPKVNSETGYSAPTVATNGTQVFAIFATGDIIALSMEGKKIWEKNLGVPKNHYGYSSSLITWKDKVIVQYDQTGNASVMALSASTGDVVWKTSRNVKVSWASPILVNTGTRMELILAADPFVASYDPASGAELWKIDCLSGEVGPSPGYGNGIAYSVNEYAKLVAVKAGNPPELLWEDNEYLSDVPSPLAIGEYLFLVTSYGVVVCYDAKTGTRHWTKEFGTTVYSSPVYAEGKIYLMNSKGKMYIFKADKTFTLIGEPQLGEGSFCTPAFYDGGLVVRGDKTLFCIGKQE